VWQPRGVQMRRLTAAAVAGLALVGLAGCRTAPNVAAYVEDERVTVSELETAVEQRLADDVIAQGPGADRESYTRSVLGTLVENDVHEAVAAEYGVEVGDREVRDLLEVLLDGQDAERAFAALAEQQGRARQDVLAEVRRLAIRLAVAEEEGLAEPLSDEGLRQRYDQMRTEATEVEFGYITVPDERVAEQVVAALDANPGRYDEIAERFAGDFTVPVRLVAPQEIPGPLAEQALAAEPNTAFAVPVEEVGGVVVGFVGEYPSFEELRPRLQAQAIGEIDEAVRPVVEEYRGNLDVVVNPRYGELREGAIEPAGDGVVQILPDHG
jgi:hypothetical protein